MEKFLKNYGKVLLFFAIVWIVLAATLLFVIEVPFSILLVMRVSFGAFVVAAVYEFVRRQKTGIE